jgi:hypothetical protein
MSKNKGEHSPEKQESVKAPAFNPETIVEASEDEINSLLTARRHRSTLTQRLEELEVGKGLKVEGVFTKIRSSVSAFTQKAGGKRFTVAEVAPGVVIIARKENKAPKVLEEAAA